MVGVLMSVNNITLFVLPLQCFLLHSVCSRIKFFQEYSYPFSSKPDKLRVS